MTKIELSTEEKILQAAVEVFVRDGYDGSRMQDIADLAGINKALLHYYFRSKDKLFERVFDEKVQSFFPQMSEILAQEISFIEKIDFFIEGYIKLLLKNPFIPLFVLNTVNKKDKQDFIQKMPLDIMRKATESYYQDLQKLQIRELNPMQFMMSLMGMCVFPFLAKPIMLRSFNATNEMFEYMMLARIDELKKYVRLILNP